VLESVVNVYICVRGFASATNISWMLVELNAVVKLLCFPYRFIMVVDVSSAGGRLGMLVYCGDP